MARSKNLIMLEEVVTKNGLKLKKEGNYNILDPFATELIETGKARLVTEKEIVKLKKAEKSTEKHK